MNMFTFESVYDSIVKEYIRDHRPSAKDEAIRFQNMKSLGHAIAEAANSDLPSGKPHPHQKRVPAASLDMARDRLLKLELPLSKCQSFEEIHSLIESAVSGIPEIGPLTVYDIAHRIGEFLRKEPEFVYMHKTATKASRALGRAASGGKLAIRGLPAPFENLKAYEIVDCFFIFRSRLRSISNS